jgi:hypothetical protein
MAKKTDRFPFKSRVEKLFSEYMDKMRKTDPSCLSDYRVNNILIDLRNQLYVLIEEVYRKLKIQLKHEIRLVKHSKSGPLKTRNSIIENKACEICGEKRTINICHIIPRENGGHDSEDNYCYLCPTHHFLFDQARLSKIEFDKISLLEKSEDTIEYFNKIHLRRHKLFWQYGTNKFVGCSCGSQKFTYDTTRNGNYVQICLKCYTCGDKWCNLWTETHHISKASIMVFDLLEKDLSDTEKEERYLAAEDKLRRYISEQLENNKYNNMA